jgi:hypothetical protein
MDTALESRLARSANWFYWIAGLSLINAFAAKSNFEFLFGSGAVAIAPAFGQTIMIVVDVVVVGGFALFGYLAGKRHTWALAIGMLLYAADGALYLIAQDYLPVLFHAYVLYLLFLGLKASMALNRIPVDARTMVMPHASTDGGGQPPATSA